ncbi:Hypothetical predicted protein [Paramuricea clavata]|uniref:Uncharacterized protein n=1 Tax=Paramuricea clavata TaxID=317549 RepID=A0A6S7I5R6_PARCT|nr:Hypothetical predicted protein [Paramuricea clavata]
MDKKQQKDKIRKSSKTFKLRRHQSQSERIANKAKKEAKEGKTYKTGVGLNLVKESSTACLVASNTTVVDIDKIIMSLTTKNHQEMTKLVPPFTERLQKKYYSYDKEKRYQFVLFDAETTCTETINGTRTLCKRFNPVSSVTLEAELQSFVKFLQDEQSLPTCGPNPIKMDNLITVLVDLNAAIFDVPTLLPNGDDSFEDKLHNMNICFGDSLLLMRALMQSNGEFCQANLGSFYKCLFDEDFVAHDALEDVIAL